MHQTMLHKDFKQSIPEGMKIFKFSYDQRNGELEDDYSAYMIAKSAVDVYIQVVNDLAYDEDEQCTTEQITDMIDLYYNKKEDSIDQGDEFNNGDDYTGWACSNLRIYPVDLGEVQFSIPDLGYYEIGADDDITLDEVRRSASVECEVVKPLWDFENNKLFKEPQCS